MEVKLRRIVKRSIRALLRIDEGEPVPFRRGDYLRLGISLMLIKYAVDTLLIHLWAGVVWTPWDYVLSVASFSGAKAAQFPAGLSFALLVWTVPFVWVGVILSVRRARDAGLPLWPIVLFFIPGANYLLMLTLAVWPSASVAPVEEVHDEDSRRQPRRQAFLLGTAAGVATGVALGVSGTLGFRSYGLSIFVVTPFVSAATAAFVAARVDPDFDSTIGVVFATLGALLATFIVLAFEGLICLVLATPLMIPIALLGGLVGHTIARSGASRASIALMLAATAGAQVVDARLTAAPTREVMTAIEIAAAPEAVWRNVVSFSEIRTPPSWLFRTGLSYPLRARIEGQGVGAIRHCEFTTGAFVEPITAWEEPSRLAFDVISQPPPLREWSPYRTVYPPHLDGFFKTSRGEFRLVPLPGGRTRLEGRTWYTLRMEPTGYWNFIADAILHRIHARVLDHIRRETEG
jgi:hypothetical protein